MNNQTWHAYGGGILLGGNMLRASYHRRVTTFRNPTCLPNSHTRS